MRLAFLSAAAVVSRIAAFATTRRSNTWRTTTSLAMSTLPRLIDVDCNLWHSDLKSLQNKNDDNPLEILQEDAVKESNIVAMVSPSSTIAEGKLGLQVLESTSNHIPIKTTVGVHPYHVNEEVLTKEKLDTIKELLQNNRHVCAAVGECGLDASEGFPDIKDQLPWFHAQVKLAQELELPLFVHERLAFEQTIECLKTVQVPILVHCFTGTRGECREYVKRGYFLSVSGFICKNGGDEVLACLEEGLIPLDKLMVETDAPYMGFDGCRELYMEKHADHVESLNSKKRKRLQKSIYPNLPSALPQVVDKVVECLNVGRTKRNEPLLSRDSVADQMTRNAIDFFGFEIE